MKLNVSRKIKFHQITYRKEYCLKKRLKTQAEIWVQFQKRAFFDSWITRPRLDVPFNWSTYRPDRRNTDYSPLHEMAHAHSTRGVNYRTDCNWLKCTSMNKIIFFFIDFEKMLVHEFCVKLSPSGPPTFEMSLTMR